MSRSFVSDPRSVVKSGDVVRVKVLSVDIGRHRIALSLRLDDDARPFGPSSRTDRGARPRSGPGGPGRPRNAEPKAPEGALADALRRAGLAPDDPDRRRRR
jgi:uncharacterized protein